MSLGEVIPGMVPREKKKQEVRDPFFNVNIIQDNGVMVSVSPRHFGSGTVGKMPTARKKTSI